MSTGSLFDFIPPPVRVSDWRPSAPPSLDGIHEIEVNVETNGLRWFDRHHPIAISLHYDGQSHYLPWAHAGGNLDEAAVKEWAVRELRGKRITNINTRFDVHMMRKWGVDLEAQGNEVSDVGHYAALLDDHRQKSSLDTLITDYFGGIEVPRLDESRMATYHAGEAQRRSRYNVEMVRKLRDVMWPELDKQDLQRVRALEDRVIYPVCEMERNGARLNTELLDRWLKESEKQVGDALMKLSLEMGFQVNPDSNKDMQRVFEKLKIPIEYTDKGGASFTDAIIKRLAKTHPLIDLVRRTGKLIDLRTKYLVKYSKCLDDHGVLRYALHQLRAVKDDLSENPGEAGTVTGRFSSTEIVRGVGKNIQQEMKAAKQRKAWGYEEEDDAHDDEIYLIRKLHVPGTPGWKWLSADAEQVEYRLFANYAQNAGILKAYEAEEIDDPETWISFHRLTHDLILPYKADQTYRQQKDYNFAVIYGAATIKQAQMMEFITKAEADQLRRDKAYDHPKLDEIKKIQAIYHRLIPEAKALQRKASHLAKPECDCRYKNDALHREFPHQGYVRDLLGRRCRFPDGDRIHKALNSVIQPGASTINKQKLVELHEARKYTNLLMRFTVHDEVDGDTPDREHALRVAEVLNHQSFPDLKIKILWGVAMGDNWASCKSVYGEEAA